MDQVLSDTINKINEEILAVSRTEIPGARLGDIVNKLCPDYRAIAKKGGGRANLSGFIDQFLSHLLIRERKQGADWIYLITDPDTSSAEPQLPPESDFENLTGIAPSTWVYFENFSSTHKLVLDLVTEKLTTIPHAGAISDAQRLIPSITLAELLDLRDQFIRQGIASGTLSNIPDEVHSKDGLSVWIGFLKQDNEAYWSWLVFRRQRTLDLLLQRLKVAGLPEQKSSLFRLALLAAKPEPRKRNAIRTSSTFGTPTQEEMAADRRLRAALHHLASHLPIEELRKISVPLGYLMGALNEQKE
jgi:hypothetical protein